MVVHELGHSFDEVLRHEWSAKPVSDYGRGRSVRGVRGSVHRMGGTPSYQTERDRLFRLTVSRPRSSTRSLCRCSSVVIA
jgi:hypothetical protein